MVDSTTGVDKEVCHLYKITNLVNGKIYIGITNNPKKRWRSHVHYANKTSDRSQVVSLAICKYGKDNFSFEVICSGERSYISDLEIAAISSYGSRVPDGYNVDGGGLNKGVNKGWSESRKASLSGLDSHASRFSKDDLDFILERDDLTSPEVSTILGCNYSAVYGVRSGRTYKNYPRPAGKDYIKAKTTGKNHHRTSLSDEDVLDIIIDSKSSTKEKAQEYGVSKSTVINIRKGRTWKHVTRPTTLSYPKAPKDYKRSSKRKYTDDQIMEVIWSTDKLPSYFTDKYGMSCSYISSIRSGAIFKNFSRPEHLDYKKGIYSEEYISNNKSRKRKCGEALYNSVLTVDSALYVLNSFGKSTASLSRELGVSESLVGNIRAGRAWKQLDRPVGPGYVKGNYSKKHKGK